MNRRNFLLLTAAIPAAAGAWWLANAETKLENFIVTYLQEHEESIIGEKIEEKTYREFAKAMVAQESNTTKTNYQHLAYAYPFYGILKRFPPTAKTLETAKTYLLSRFLLSTNFYRREQTDKVQFIAYNKPYAVCQNPLANFVYSAENQNAY